MKAVVLEEQGVINVVAALGLRFRNGVRFGDSSLWSPFSAMCSGVVWAIRMVGCGKCAGLAAGSV